MEEKEHISIWLERLKADSSDAARHLWEAYFQRMVRLAQQQLPQGRRRMADEEDVALSAFNSFCKGVREGRFQHLVNRESLWPLLVAMTLHKARDLARHEFRQKRGGRAAPMPLLEEILSREPTPEFTMQLAEELERRLASLNRTGDNEIRAIVLWSLEGYDTREIAEKLQCTVRTVQRKLKIVRRMWMEENE